MRQLEQVRTAGGQVFPSPRAGEEMFESPPTFCFLYENGFQQYTVSVRREGRIVWQGTTEKNFINPDIILPPGRYEWNLTAEDAERGWLPFSISEKAVQWLRPAPETIFAAVPEARPRHLFCKEDIPALLAEKSNAIDTLKRNITLALEHGMPVPPRYHRDPGALPYREYFGRHRDFCDRDLVACALGHQLLSDARKFAHHRMHSAIICRPCASRPAFPQPFCAQHR